MNVAPITPLINPEARLSQQPGAVRSPATAQKLPQLPKLPRISGLTGQDQVQAGKGAASGSAFLSELLSRVVTTDAAAQKAVDNYSTGATQNLHETMVTLGKADISFSLMVSVRNKLLNAYREIMKM